MQRVGQVKVPPTQNCIPQSNRIK